ncbi:MAG: disulfide bond formation protein B [Candidatus Liptonbacteria bacterium]|nr:disulfide bond formation protein B [Candidatus Liptonbacteria bacterium]
MSPLVQVATNIFSFFTLLADILIVAIILAILTKRFGVNQYLPKRFLDFFGVNALVLSFIAALVGTASSLFYSEIAGFAPCVLCWWQRIFLYPQVFILGAALWRKEMNVLVYTLPLSIIGGLIAMYHSYLQFGGLPLVPCPATGPSCAQVYFVEYGYVTIPMMALTAFALLIVLSLARRV